LRAGQWIGKIGMIELSDLLTSATAGIEPDYFQLSIFGCCEFGALGKNFDHIQLSTELPGQSDIGSVLQSICVSGRCHEFSDHNFEGVGRAS
jgi:hypothetical protein